MKYVVWDGINEVDFTEDTSYHDCIILYDGYVSVKKLRKEIIAKGQVPTILFACKSGEEAMEMKFQGKGTGVFSHYWKSMVSNNPDLTFRDAVRLVNQTMKQDSIKQNCEVVCRSDVLDLKVLNPPVSGAAHILMLLDMCRTKSGKNSEKIY